MEDVIYDIYDLIDLFQRKRGFQEVFTEDIESEANLTKYLQGHPLPSSVAVRCTFKWDEQENIGLLVFQFNEFCWLQGQWNLPEDLKKKQVYLDRTKITALRCALTEVKIVQEYWQEWYHIYTEEERKELEAAANEQTVPF